MKFFYSMALLCLLNAVSAYAQKVEDILYHGKVIDNDKNLYLKIEDNKLKYYMGSGDKSRPQKFSNSKKEQYFLIKDDGVDILMRPVNPLNFSVNSAISSRIDSIESASNAALALIVSQIATFAKSDAPKNAAGTPTEQCNTAIAEIKTKFDGIGKLLLNNQKNEVNAAFNKLKGISFETKAAANDGLVAVNPSIVAINKHFKTLDSAIANVKAAITNFSLFCPDTSTQFIFTSVANSTLASIIVERDSQMKRLTALQNAYNLVKMAYDSAAFSIDNSLEWFVKVKTVDVEDEKIIDVKLTLNKSGFELSDKQEITETKTEPIDNYVLSFKPFRRFVPEISAGIAYADITFHKYGTTTNEAGETVVGDAGDDKVSKFNVNTMLNFNYYIANSSINPFLQLGIGAGTDYPALFTGVGIRIGYKPLSRLSLSVGYVSPWIKELGTLKPGDKITGTADIEKDTVHRFKWLEGRYFGIQIKI